MPTPPLDPKVITEQDGYLEPDVPAIIARHEVFRKWKDTIEQFEGGYDNFTKGYLKFGFNFGKNGEVVYREWAPNVVEANLIGDFNQWNRTTHPLKKDRFGIWEVTVPPTSPGICAIPHDSKIKISMITPSGIRIERLPTWIRRVTQDLSVSPLYDGRFWNPPESGKYKFKNSRIPKPTDVRIYEAHVGISTAEPRVGTYKEFTRNILPRIRDLGYNVIQLMAIMEHAYYASFGYQVTSFFAASSRYGTPEDLKELIDTAHGMGLTVLLDIVHSHACKNVLDGLNEFDGTDHLYFHEGGKGRHELWDSRLFNYSQHEVLRFLLSNLRFYMEEFQFDGFRFDGVTSMMYKHHGIGTGFSGGYHEYFGDAADIEAIVYLMLANDAIHTLYPNAITIAEDVSGMPLLGVPVDKGGVGFDYRLSMAIPDMWIKLLKHKSDDEWDLANIVHTLTNRRYGEKSIAYCESHDQALVGDKTLAFWLMDKEMYTNMSDLTEMTPVISRGLALHKMIRLLTQSLGGEGYLNFEGNEFGHPEWLDFPREGNQNSFHYARRQWNVVDDPILRYRYLNNFDSAMNHLAGKYSYLEAPQVKLSDASRASIDSNLSASAQAYVSLKNEEDKIIVYERAGLLFIFNFHPTKSYTDYRVGVEEAGVYRIVLSSDDDRFGGFGNIKTDVDFLTTPLGWNGRKNWLQVYIPARTCIVLALK
ncbi:alpha-1,4-glucan branching enzyme [Sphagnurus paluster]|uniref:1,4-alpha-glucan-branching enzyme n=1 Tax=Sphagnurus paluster TaxID=117069 RepID=A0A9P7GPW3_9AGAR|nr:alpha-1,4-glucan branching enzyme [Sphagnurus paluster]